MLNIIRRLTWSRKWGCQWITIVLIQGHYPVKQDVLGHCGKKRGYIENIAKRPHYIWRTYVIVQLNFVYSQIQESWKKYFIFDTKKNYLKIFKPGKKKACVNPQLLGVNPKLLKGPR